MAKRYYTLAVREDGQWTAQFGDYDRETVQAELDDYVDHDYRKRDLRIVQSNDDQASIMNAVARLNA